MSGIAVIGLACRYPGARTPAELWENVLARRAAFRPIPPQRLRLADYGGDGGADRTYARDAAVLEGWAFDRVRFRVSGASFRAADPAHWLALEVAADALADAGFAEGDGLPRASTAVLVGNTLTGEFSRAGLMRLRWPYVRRVLAGALRGRGMGDDELAGLLESVESTYKAPFPVPDGETLAGGLSNTIAGRICNHFDLNGGGWTVDGACASSLLAVAQGCSLLAAGDADVVLAGGVDLSLDPFELVGFARAGALARGAMRVYDRRSAGFIPGEGCAFAVLVREDDARDLRRGAYATVRGWGVSTDGAGGLTRPEAEGQRLALERAYARAGFGPEAVALFEGHGTGTEVGDAVELRALASARRRAGARDAAAVGSVKALIGHTKAAAGIAGFVKAAMAVHARVLPPTAGCDEPHPELAGDPPVLRVLHDAEPWPAGELPRAAVSAMGFGGINAHVVIEGAAPAPRRALDARTRTLARSGQDAELFLVSAPDAAGLARRIDALRTRAETLSIAELGDAAAQLAATLEPGWVRGAVVAADARELARGLDALREAAVRGEPRMDPRAGVFLGMGDAAPRIGLLFPGQGSPAHLGGGLLRRRFPAFEAAYGRADLPASGDGVATEVAQPAIAAASAAALALLRSLGVEAEAGVGHSLGELAALHWAGALSLGALLRTAAARGRAMGELPGARGAMLSLAAGRAEAERLIRGTSVVVAGVNAPLRTVVAGGEAEIAAVAARAAERGIEARRLAVSHAFHSPLVAPAAAPLAEHLAGEEVGPVRRLVASTVTGRVLAEGDDPRALLVRQVTSPVLFLDALRAAEPGVDLWIECGPGHALTALAEGVAEAPVVALDAGGSSLSGLLKAFGAAFALGAPVSASALFDGRFTRPIDLSTPPRFLASPCELVPTFDVDPSASIRLVPSAELAARPHGNGNGASGDGDGSTLEVVRRLVARRAELPEDAVRGGDRLLGDLHLNSIVVGELVAEASRLLGRRPPAAPTEYASATVAEIARALDELEETSASSEENGHPAGVDAWVRPFAVDWRERPLPPRAESPAGDARWRVLAGEAHPFAAKLAEALDAGAPGGGVAVCLATEPDERDAERLLEGAHRLAEAAPRFVVVQHGGGGSAFARVLHLETGAAACVVDFGEDDSSAVSRVVAEAAAARGFVEARYDATGARREPFARVLEDDGFVDGPALGPGDVLLATGGARGITAECALALARRTGVRLALVGRSRAEDDAALAASLERIAAAGVVARYFAADVSGAEAMRDAVRRAEVALGPVTAVLHGAGVNAPRLVSALDAALLRETIAPKVRGLDHLLAALDPARLKLLVAFGSIIGRMGVPGAAHYALANEWLRHRVERFAGEVPACRCVVMEWSIWSDVGMGARLGRVDALLRAGVSPVSPDAGVRAFLELAARPPSRPAVIVTGRFGPPPTLALEERELPLRRFLECPRVHYPGVELVADAELSADTDPYLDDHRVRGERLLPAVLGLEAMAQAAAALAGAGRPVAFEDVRFDRPVAVPAGGRAGVRVAALVRVPGVVDCVLRCASTGYQADHFRATCHVSSPEAPFASGLDVVADDRPVALDPAAELYGGVCFHRGRFRRVARYRRLHALECVAEVAADGAAPWFAPWLPPTLLLGDPGARDATIHAIQACIPHALVLPVAIARLTVLRVDIDGERTVAARERAREGDELVWDVEVRDAAGDLAERWDGLRLRIVSPLELEGGWPPALLGPFAERRIAELVPGAALSVAVERGDGDRRARGDIAIRRVVATPAELRRRGDGRPVVADGETAVSAAHAGELTLAVAARGCAGCDLEPVTPRPAAVWRDLLGAERANLAALITAETGEDFDIAATRAWCAAEALKKAGAPPDAPLVLASASADGWVLLRSGALPVASWAGPVRRASGTEPMVLAAVASPAEAPSTVPLTVAVLEGAPALRPA